MTDKIIPFYSTYIPKDILIYLKEVFDSGYISGGKVVEDFEKNFTQKFGCLGAVSVNSCTSALRLSLAVAGVKSGDEVISTPFTMLATNSVILEQLATPIFADIQYNTGNIDPNDIEHRITEKTKAIMIVDIGGYPCDLKEILKIGHQYNLAIIEDSAHAIGAKYNGKYIGTYSDFTCFSFYATKHITTGDGGMITVKSKNNAKEAKEGRWYGMDKFKRFKQNYLGYGDFDIKKLGFKYNMNAISAMMGDISLKHIDEILIRRMEIAKRYREELITVKDLELFDWEKDRISSNWLFPVHVKRRLKFGKMMYDKGIEVSISYRRNDRYSILGGFRKDLPVMDRFDKDTIYIPIHCSLSDEDVDYIIKAVKGGW